MLILLDSFEVLGEFDAGELLLFLLMAQKVYIDSFSFEKFLFELEDDLYWSFMGLFY